MDAPSAIEAIPLGGLVPLAVLTVVGLVLWSAGRRVLRAALAMVGLVVGGVAGWIFGELLPPQLGIPVWVFAAFDALLVACVFALAWRVTVMLALSAVLAVGTPMTVWAAATAFPDAFGIAATAPDPDPEPGPDAETPPPSDAVAMAPEAPATDAITDWVERLGRDPEEAAADAAADAASDAVADRLGPEAGDLGERLGLDRETTEQAIEDAGDFVRRVGADLGSAWDDVPTTLRSTLLGAAAIGLLAGFLLGSLTPNLSAAIVTSFGGALLWLSTALALAGRLAVPVEGLLPSSPHGWLILWSALSVIGLAIQWTFRTKAADTSG